MSQRMTFLSKLTVTGTLAGSAGVSSTRKYSNASLISSSIMGTLTTICLVRPIGKVTLIGSGEKSDLPGSERNHDLHVNCH